MAAPSAFQSYAKNLNVFKLSDLDASANIRLALVTNSYVPSTVVTGHSLYSDITNELTTSGGYTAGGFALTGSVATSGTTGYQFSTGNASWTASGGGIPAWRYGILYYTGTLWGLASPLLGYFIGDSTPTDVPATSAGNTLQLNCPSGGWFTSLRV